MQAEVVFQARGLTKIYQVGETAVHALRGVDLDLFKGELVVLLGASGSGKSTLLNILGGLDKPTNGHVIYGGHDLVKATERELTEYRRYHVGFVFQFYNLIPSLTARENVAVVTEIARNPMSPEKALALVHLADRMDHFPAQLSGGEQQRVAIARAIAKRPAVLLCDEPTGALDSITGIVVLEALANVNQELGTTTAVITHNAAIGGMADRVIHFSDGHIAGIDRNVEKISPAGFKLVTALTRKLFRDLWHMRSQALAIMIVIASGVATFVMSVSTLDSLQRTRAQVYAEFRFADIFAPLKRAPERITKRLAAIPGVREVESRIVAEVRMEVAGFPDPVIGRLVSIPDYHEPKMNALYLRSGRMPLLNQTGQQEVVLSEPFAKAHQLLPGDAITAIINGHRQMLRISGIALSPEYIYSLGPGAMFPDNARFGILWMNRKALASAYDMDGAFNDAVLKLMGNVKPADIIESVDRILARYGGMGSFERRHQQSHHFLSQEFIGLETMATIFPVVFLGVAAFLLNVVVTRVISTEREQIAVLKAFGYSNATIGWHYLQLVLIITALGVIAGIFSGRWLGQGLGNIYMDFFHFPYLDYRLENNTIALAFFIGFSAAIAGTLHAVMRAAKLPPAEAMRPEPPARYRESVFERSGIRRFLSQPSRMILRHISRKPLKTLLTIIGIAMAGAIMMISNFQDDAIDHMLHVHYKLTHQEDLTVTFNDPASRRALYEIASLPGVTYAEPFRQAPVRIRYRHREQRTVVQAFDDSMSLRRVLDRNLEPFALPPEGIVLNDYLAELLGVNVGDHVVVEVLTGRRPKFEIEVVATVGEMLGIPVYMHIDALNRRLDEGNAIDGTFLAVDRPFMNAVHRELQDMPKVAGITIREAAIQSAYDTMGDTILIFTFINTILATGIAFGVIYNSMRIAFSERSRELASLRVLGFSRAEVAYILLGELAVLTLIAIPIGFVIGKEICAMIAVHMNSELYRVPLIIEMSSYAFSAAVVLASAILSGLIIWRRLEKLDLVAVLKTRE